MDLKPDPSLRDPHFDGYKLSLDPTPVYKMGLESAVDTVMLREDQFSLQHVKAFGLHNHLYKDLWCGCVLLVDDQWKVCRHAVDKEPPLDPPAVVFQIPKAAELQHNPDRLSVTLHCTSVEWLVVADGVGNLYVVHSSNRQQDQNWQLSSCLTPELTEDADVTSPRPFIVLHSVLRPSRGDDAVLASIDVLLLHIANNPHANSEHTEQTHITKLTWLSLEQVSQDQWRSGRRRCLAGYSSPDYISLLPDPEAIVVASSKPFRFVYDSDDPVHRGPETPSVNGTPDAGAKGTSDAANGTSEAGQTEQTTEPESVELRYVWTQTEEDLSLFFSLPPDTNKEDIDYKLTNSTVSLGITQSRVLLAGELVGRVDTDTSTWTMSADPTGHNRLELHLEKAEVGVVWSDVVLGDRNGRQVADTDTQDAIDVMMSQRDDQIPGVSDQKAYNAQQLEDCDTYQDDSASLVYFSGHNSKYQVGLGSHQWLFSAEAESGKPPCFCLRHDVDGLVWQVSPPDQEDGASPWCHVATFNAFGYVQASKQDKKFASCAPDFSYAVISDCSRRIYIYRQPASIHSPIRNRKTGRQVAALAKQQLVSLDTVDSTDGLQVFNDKLFVLTARDLYMVRVNVDTP